MQIVTDLRPMFSYSIIYILILIVLLILTIIYLITHKKPKKEIIEMLVVPDYKDLVAIKNKYFSLIQNLLNDFKSKKISNRHAYQSLSKLIRNFIYEVTNINVQNYTLEDIKSINIPILYELVKEYYDPEFARISLGNMENAIDKTREVIAKWK